MRNDKKSKKNRIDRLRELLDNNNGKDSQSKNEIYLKSLSRRLKDSSYEIMHVKKVTPKDNGGSEKDSLEPKIKIHERIEKKIIDFAETEREKTNVSIEKPSEVEFLSTGERKDLRIEDEDIFEIEKAKLPGPEFIEVKPKKELKKEKEIKFEEKVTPDQEVMEWEPIDIKKEKHSEEGQDLKVSYCENCGAQLKEEAKFCENCGNKLHEEQEPEKVEEKEVTFIPVEPEKEIKSEQQTEWEPIETEPVTFEEIKQEDIQKEEPELKKKENIQEKIELIPQVTQTNIEYKIQPFSELNSIDDATAILLYDNGFTTVSLLKEATIKDLRKIKGIKRKKAKEIIEELKQKDTEWRYSGVEEIFEKQIEEEITEEKGKTCDKCGAELIEGTNFCEECGNQINKEYDEPKNIEPEIEEEKTITFIPIKPKEEREDEWQPIDIKKEKVKEEQTVEIKPITEPEIEEKPEEIPQETQIGLEEKIKPFDEINSIDEKTAILLFDNGFTTLESLNFATIKDLRKIKGIKRKKAKEIKEELEKKGEWEPIVTEETVEEQIIENTSEIIKDTVEDDIEEQVTILDNIEKIEAFKEIECIDDDTAILLYDNGFTTVSLLKEATIKDLRKIKGIKRKKAKEIKEELKLKIEVFGDIESIDDETAILLYNNGFINVESLKNISYKDLAKSAGIKRNLAKKIVKDINELIKEILVEKETKINNEDLEKPEELEQKDNNLNLEEENKIEEENVKEPAIEDEIKIEVFKDIKSIDNDTAILLYDNGFTTVDLLKEATIKDLRKIKGIKRKKAKEIKEELEPKIEPEQVNSFKEDDKKIETSEEEKIPEPDEIQEEKDEAFNEINSIDAIISKLLIEHDIKSLKDIYNTTIKDLTKIKGIRKKVAKEIKKEVNNVLRKKISELASKGKYNRGENPFVEESSDDWDDWEYFDEKKISDNVIKEIKGFIYKDYTLYEKIIETKSGVKRTIRFFSKAEPEKAEPVDLPKGYDVKENKKTGVPYLRKKK